MTYKYNFSASVLSSNVEELVHGWAKGGLTSTAELESMPPGEGPYDVEVRATNYGVPFSGLRLNKHEFLWAKGEAKELTRKVHIDAHGSFALEEVIPIRHGWLSVDAKVLIEGQLVPSDGLKAAEEGTTVLGGEYTVWPLCNIKAKITPQGWIERWLLKKMYKSEYVTMVVKLKTERVTSEPPEPPPGPTPSPDWPFPSESDKHGLTLTNGKLVCNGKETKLYQSCWILRYPELNSDAKYSIADFARFLQWQVQRGCNAIGLHHLLMGYKPGGSMGVGQPNEKFLDILSDMVELAFEQRVWVCLGLFDTWSTPTSDPWGQTVTDSTKHPINAWSNSAKQRKEAREFISQVLEHLMAPHVVIELCNEYQHSPHGSTDQDRFIHNTGEVFVPAIRKIYTPTDKQWYIPVGLSEPGYPSNTPVDMPFQHRLQVPARKYTWINEVAESVGDCKGWEHKAAFSNDAVTYWEKNAPKAMGSSNCIGMALNTHFNWWEVDLKTAVLYYWHEKARKDGLI